MGRPIKKKYFGNLNTGGVGGEGFSSVTVLNTTTNGLYTTATTVTWLASTPQVPGGTAASGTANVSVAGRITSLNILSAGTGYSSTSSVTVAFTPATTGTTATYLVSLTSAIANAINVSAFVLGGSARSVGDIIKQESSRRYLVRTVDGVGQCRLITTSTLTTSTMNIIATDVIGSTYYVSKLTARRAYLIQQTDGGSGFEYLDDQSTHWILNGASTGTVSIANL